MFKILITPLTSKDFAQSQQLLRLYEYADKGKYAITENPEEADLILVTDGHFDNYGEKVFENKYLKEYTNKSFLLANVFKPLPLFRGILTTGEKSIFNFGRIRSSSYTSGWSNFRNSYIEDHYLKNGNPSDRKFLFSFIGRDCDPARKKIFETVFKRKDLIIENSDSSFNLYERDENFIDRQKYYYETLLQSKFALAPRGWSANSYRLFEAMMLGIAPVIISDEWILPKGPDWKSFSLIIPTKNIKFLEEEIIRNEHRYLEMGALAKKAFEKYFDDKVFFEYVINNCQEIQKKQFISESFFFHNISPRIAGYLKFKNGKLVSIRNGFKLVFTQPNQIFSRTTFVKFKRFFCK